MQIMRLANGVLATQKVQFSGTDATVEIAAAGMGMITGVMVVPVGTSNPGSIAQYRLSESVVGGGEYVGVPASGKLTLARDVEDAGTLVSDEEVLVTLIGY